MKIEYVTDPSDDRLSGYRDLTDVALRVRFEPASGVYIAESASVIERALSAGHAPVSVLMEDKWVERMQPVLSHVADVPVYVGNKDVLEQLTGFHVHRGALALMLRPSLPTVDQVIAGAQRIVVLEDIVDHTNVGAIIRSAAGLGFDGFLVSPRCADPLYRRSVRVSMGTVFDLPWTRLDSWPTDLQLLRDAGFVVAAMTPRADAIDLDVFDPPGKVALVLGTEGDGLSTRALDQVDVAVRIPMQRGVDSLNVAAAAAVVCWHLRPSGM
ncbi:MAG: RNA methyltransferase [Actinomycetota bacterium]|nr:RNA methyltransferase [Actinomycetota bacterium]